MDSKKFAVITLFDDNYKVGFICAASHEAYAQKHGYLHRCIVLDPASLNTLCQGRAPQWGKVALLRNLLSASLERKRCADVAQGWDITDVEWLVWIDADAIVLNHSKKLEDFTSMAGPESNFVIGEDMSCASSINTGVMFVRRCKWCLSLLEKVWNCEPRLHRGPFHEQTSLCEILRREVPEHSMDSEWWWSWRGGPRRRAIGAHTFVVDCGSINYKHPEQAQFVVHFVDNPRAGPTKVDRAQKLLRERWVRAGEKLNSLGASEKSTSSSSSVRSEHTAARKLWNETAGNGFGATTAGWPETLPPPPMQRSRTIKRFGIADQRHALLSLVNSKPFLIDSHSTGDEEQRWSLEWIEEQFGESLAKVYPFAPHRCVDGQVEIHCVKLWQLCCYVRGNFPPLNPILSGRDGGTGHLWRMCSWRPPQGSRIRLPLAPAILKDALGTQQKQEEDQWAELQLQPPGAVTRPHRNNLGTHLVILQLTGSMEVVLCSPENGNALRSAGKETHDELQSGWDPWTAADNITVEAPCEVWRCTCKRGDVLVVPQDWWFTSLTTAPSLSVFRHIVNETNHATFAARQRHAQEAFSKLHKPDDAASASFCPVLETLRAPGHAAWIASDAPRLGRPARGDLCIVHFELRAQDGRLLVSTRLPPGAPPRLVKAGEVAPSWQSSLASAAMLAATVGQTTRVVLASSLVFAVAPKVPVDSGSLIMVELQILEVLAPDVEPTVLCGSCGAADAPLLCTGCRRVRYCSSACQRAAWKAHKPECRASASASTAVDRTSISGHESSDTCVVFGPGTGVDLGRSCVLGDQASRGIVVCAGGPYLTLAWISLKLLRSFCGCMLPVEVWHLPGEISAEAAAAMTAIPGVVLRQLEIDVPRKRPGIWAVKPLAVACSRFREVLLLDADNIPILDPDVLFESSAYKSTGALFWPDYVPYPEKEGSATWRALSAGRWSARPVEITWEMESGQCVIDKHRCQLAVKQLAESALHLEELAPHLPGDGGDKDLFQISWTLAGSPFFLNPHLPAAVGVDMESRRVTPRGAFVGHTMVQHGLDGTPMFLHRTIDKHEDPFVLAWQRIATSKLGPAASAFELERMCPTGRIKVRIVPRSVQAVKVRDFSECIPRGSELCTAFDHLVRELRAATWSHS